MIPVVESNYIYTKKPAKIDRFLFSVQNVVQNVVTI
jgi:hypothetical protein